LDVAGRLPLVEWVGSTVVDELLAVAGRGAKKKRKLFFDF